MIVMIIRMVTVIVFTTLYSMVQKCLRENFLTLVYFLLEWVFGQKVFIIIKVFTSF